MGMEFPLSRLEPGESAVVSRVETGGAMGRRLRDLGLIAGTAVTCLGRSPWGDPSAYGFRGAVIALRARDCAGVRCTRGAQP